MNLDVAIVGGGLVGAALARALRGMRVALVAQARSPVPPRAGEFDSRIYAISPGNAAFFAELKVWQQLPAERVTPVHAMRVHGDDGESLLEFDAYDAGVGELAWIVEDGLLQDALWRSLRQQEDCEIHGGEAIGRQEAGADAATLELRNGKALRAKLVVGADGARSAVRTSAGIEAEERSYHQSAVVANFACARPHRNVAWQWFQGGPVLALLPLPGNRVSMVWSTSEPQAARLAGLDGPSLCAEVAAAARDCVGALTLITPQRRFRLRRVVAKRLIAPRVALVGDAAHVIHPLAGQGANLGFQDARELAAVLAAREPSRDPGDFRLLRRYERSRAEAILAMRTAVDGLFRLFDSRSSAVSKLRNAGLNLTDRATVLKNILIRQAMR
jgi:ubiquinone biosynthesis UbiH/UbiF/VisC/COQ6 family hydroxylase